jgi:hypothetical protein
MKVLVSAAIVIPAVLFVLWATAQKRKKKKGKLGQEEIFNDFY